MSDNLAQTGRQVAVVIVHGVGGTEPGAALDEVVDALQANFTQEFQPASYSEVYRLASPPVVSGEPVDKFRAHARTATLTATGDRVRFYDLHWADLTHSPPGRLNAFLGAFRIIFESHHFIDTMLPKDSGPLSRQLRSLLIWAAALLRGPIVGVSACLVAVGLALYFGYVQLSKWAPMLLPGHPRPVELATLWLVIVVMAVLFLAVLVLFYRRARWRETEWNDVFVAIMFGAIFVSVFAWLLYSYPESRLLRGDYAFPESRLLRGNDKPDPEMCVYVGRFYYVTQSIRALWYFFLIAAFALVARLYLFARASANEVRPGAAMAATSIVVLQSALWLTLLSAFAIPIINQADLYKEAGYNLSSCELEGLHVSFAGTAALLGGVGWCILLTYMARSWLARLPLLSDERRMRLMPRLLFGGLITLAVLAGALLQGVIFAWSYFAAFADNNDLFRFLGVTFGVPDITGLYNKRRYFYAPIGVLAVGVSMLISLGLTTGIQITRDLIDHHYSPKLGYSYYLLPKSWRLGPHKPRRQRILQRLDTLAGEVICKEPFDDLVFVMHSQGSVIVYDYLQLGSPQCRELMRVRPHIVTFGSPLGHLYQFYFKEYSNLDEGIAALRPHLASWTNLYRADDYVGREIAARGDGFVRNRVLRAGGHIDYWRDPCVANAIMDCLRTPASAASAAPATSLRKTND